MVCAEHSLSKLTKIAVQLFLTLLEGFSLIGSKNWLKIVRRVDCLLFGSTIK
uniref:REC114 meiotic recombination protein n=1 Tax=Chinchilla lanigera TaxID=34839 RepID=A0A8C2UYY4_CHILA